MTVALRGGRVDLDRREVLRGDRRVELRAKEAELLRYLAANAGRTVSREELFERVWGYHPGTASRTLDTTVRRLRAAIEDDPATPRHLLTDVGVGYRFVGAEPPDPCRLALEAGAGRIRALLGRRTPGRVVLYGPHGVGKRTWALEAASSFPERVIQGGGRDVLLQLAVALGVDPAGDPGRLRRRLESARAGALLLLDDVPLDEVVRWAPPVVARQVPPPPADPRYEAVAVEPLPREAARALLLRRGPAEGEGLDRLLDLLAGIPLAIELAAARLPFVSPGALADALVAEPERLYDGVTEDVPRAASLARASLDPPTLAALEALSVLPGPVPTAVVAAAAGGLGMLARLRELVCLTSAGGGWIVPLSVRVREPGGRARSLAADALASALSGRCDPLWGPVTWEAHAELAALVPTLRAFADDPRLGPLFVWALVAAGAQDEAVRAAGALREACPLAWAARSSDPLDERLAVVERLAPTVDRDAVRCRLLRQAGRLDDADAVPEPDGADEGLAVGEWWHERHHLAAARIDHARARAASIRAARAWRRFPVQLERARAANAYLAMLAGHLARAEHEYAALARSPDPAHALEGRLGLGFVGLLRGAPARAREAAEQATASVGRLADPLAISVWNQIGLLWREIGEVERVAEAVSAAIELVELAGGPVALGGALHTTLGAALLDAGRLEEAIAELAASRAVLDRMGLLERVRYADLLTLVARELRGDDVAAEWRAVEHGGEERLDHLIAAFAGRPTAEALRYADATVDRALGGVASAMLGRSVPAEVHGCSFEARIAERLHAHRCHIGSHGPVSHSG